MLVPKAVEHVNTRSIFDDGAALILKHGSQMLSEIVEEKVAKMVKHGSNGGQD